MRNVAIVGAVRTPIGSQMGVFKSLSVVDLGVAAVKGVLERSGVPADLVQKVVMGIVLPAGAGQAPERQVALGAGLPDTVPCFAVQQVCASGLRSVITGAQQIMLGEVDCVIVGGMESMSRVPYLNFKQRSGQKMGPVVTEDGLLYDGLTDPYNRQHMGLFAELCAKEHDISRGTQDASAILSYERTRAAWAAGLFDDEVIPVSVPQRRGDPIVVTQDEEPANFNQERMIKMRPAFQRDGGTVTGPNASKISDGATAQVLMSTDKAKELGLEPLAVIRGWGERSQDPSWFTTAPAPALRNALTMTSQGMAAPLEPGDLDSVEINEAFAVVTEVNKRELGLGDERVNRNGGAVSTGHPVGASGGIILTRLVHQMKRDNLQWGGVTICHGGGGVLAMIVERPAD